MWDGEEIVNVVNPTCIAARQRTRVKVNQESIPELNPSNTRKFVGVLFSRFPKYCTALYSTVAEPARDKISLGKIPANSEFLGERLRSTVHIPTQYPELRCKEGQDACPPNTSGE